jgi:tRNA threonylcarbamoyl adenosine modification protein (Sua5/YciO/YrdC/YwlC family)
MAIIYEVHPTNPQERQIQKITDALRDGAIMLYPTDTVYAIGCDLTVKSAVQKVRQIKQLSNDKPLTFLCPSLSNIASYAIVTDMAYRFIKRLIPGPYTFILPASKAVPKLVMEPKRKTTGIRVPEQQVCLAIMSALNNPIISTSAHIDDDDELAGPMEKAVLFDHLDKIVDIIIDDDSDPGNQVSTMIDLTDEEPTVMRQGLGMEMVNTLLGEFV